MNVILLTAIVFTVALVHGEQEMSLNGPPPYTIRPCTVNSGNYAYGGFVRRHVLQYNFNTYNLQAWKSYLVRNGLCGRVQVQSFITRETQIRVERICKMGSRVQGDTVGNLCISRIPLPYFEVVSVKNSYGCRVFSATLRKQLLTVACNIVGNQCLPVNLVPFRYQRPSNIACV